MQRSPDQSERSTDSPSFPAGYEPPPDKTHTASSFKHVQKSPDHMSNGGSKSPGGPEKQAIFKNRSSQGSPAKAGQVDPERRRKQDEMRGITRDESETNAGHEVSVC